MKFFKVFMVRIFYKKSELLLCGRNKKVEGSRLEENSSSIKKKVIK